MFVESIDFIANLDDHRILELNTTIRDILPLLQWLSLDRNRSSSY